MTAPRTTTVPVNTQLPFAPLSYDVTYFNRMIGLLRQFMDTTNRATRNPTTITVTGMPLTGNLLPVGSVYQDYDTLKVVVARALYAPAFAVSADIGTVSWTIT